MNLKDSFAAGAGTALISGLTALFGGLGMIAVSSGQAGAPAVYLSTLACGLVGALVCADAVRAANQLKIRSSAPASIVCTAGYLTAAALVVGLFSTAGYQQQEPRATAGAAVLSPAP